MPTNTKPTGFNASTSVCSTVLKTPRIVLMLVVLAGQSVLAAPQICENERQQVIAATQGQNKADIDETIGWVQSTIYNGNNWCQAFRGDVKSAEYGNALKTCANAHEVNAEQDRSEYRGVRLPQYKLFACVARYLATQIKPKRQYQ